MRCSAGRASGAVAAGREHVFFPPIAGREAAVALGQRADVACEFVLAHALRGQRERFLEPDGVRNDLRDQLVDRLDADRFEHGFELLFVADADVAFGKFVEHIC